MEKKVYFTAWEGSDGSNEISLFEYGWLARRKRGTNEWQVMHLVDDRVFDEPMYQMDWFNPDDFIKQLQEEDSWMKPYSMISTLGFESVESMIDAWKERPLWCLSDLLSYHGACNILEGGYHYRVYTEKQVRKRLGRAISK